MYISASFDKCMSFFFFLRKTSNSEKQKFMRFGQRSRQDHPLKGHLMDDKESGFLSKCSRKPLESFKQGSDMIQFMLENSLPILSGEWIVRNIQGRKASY